MVEDMLQQKVIEQLAVCIKSCVYWCARRTDRIGAAWTIGSLMHGRKSRGGAWGASPRPRIWSGGRQMQIAPHNVTFQNLKHQIACI